MRWLVPLETSIAIIVILGSVAGNSTNSTDGGKSLDNICQVLAQNNNHDEICKDTTLYPLTSPPGKAEHMILCHPVGKALAAANNANLQFNAGLGLQLSLSKKECIKLS